MQCLKTPHNLYLLAELILQISTPDTHPTICNVPRLHELTTCSPEPITQTMEVDLTRQRTDSLIVEDSAMVSVKFGCVYIGEEDCIS
jgi:hypothetical protein